MTTAERKLDLARKLLRGVFAVVPLVAGIDKFFGYIADWEMYLSPKVAALLPVSETIFLRTAGVAEIAVGLLMLTAWSRLAAYLVSAWLFLITVNLLVSWQFLDVAVRDLALSLCALALALLTEARAQRPTSPSS
jgi:uncharacterized membrane protein